MNITVKLQGERLLVGFRIQEVDLAHLKVWTEPADSIEAWCTCSTMYLSGNAHQRRLGCTSWWTEAMGGVGRADSKHPGEGPRSAGLSQLCPRNPHSAGGEGAGVGALALREGWSLLTLLT